MAQSKQVHIRVGENRREKWKTHATEEHGDKYGNLSSFVRHAVERQIEIDQGDGTRGGSQVEEIGAVLSGLEQLDERVTGVSTEIKRLREDVKATGSVSDTLLSDVFGILDEQTSYIEPLTPSTVAEELGIAGRDAERALAKARESHDDVKAHFPEDGEPKYWRKQ